MTYENCTLWIEFFGTFRAENMGIATESFKKIESLEAFKSKIKSWIHGWIPGNCPCRNFKP